MIIKNKKLELHNVSHGFFSSIGGFSSIPFKGLNCSFDTGDNASTVNKNLNKVKKILNVNLIRYLKQTHSSKAVIINYKNLNDPSIKADGMVTKLTKVGLGILTADCSPILFLDKYLNVIGACHAGWRGAVNGIIKSTVFEMKKLGSRNKDIIAIIGPTIQKESYEIGQDLSFKIKTTDVYQKNKKILQRTSGNRYLFDLPLFIKEKLLLIGIDKIEDVHLDTYNNKNFFSYRRTTHETQSLNSKNNENLTGRQISIIGLM